MREPPLAPFFSKVPGPPSKVTTLIWGMIVRREWKHSVLEPRRVIRMGKPVMIPSSPEWDSTFFFKKNAIPRKNPVIVKGKIVKIYPCTGFASGTFARISSRNFSKWSSSSCSERSLPLQARRYTQSMIFSMTNST